nr:zinc finger BED domain-containing protein RICESLEEPER 3-like [Nicotiana tomentosiformis]
MYADDHKYQKYYREISALRGNPSGDDWKNVKAFIKFLNIFYQTTLKFSSSLYATSNSFFHEFFNLRNAIIKYTKSDDRILNDMAGRMKSKLEKYWGKFEDMNMLLLVVVVVLDPRYKMKYVNFILTDAFGSLLGRLKSEDVASNDNIGGDTSMSEVGDLLQSKWEKLLEDEGNIFKKYDLEIYLMDDVVKIKNFNILAWWFNSGFLSEFFITKNSRSSYFHSTMDTTPSKEYKFEDMLEEVQKIEQVEEEYADSPLRID